MLWLQPIHPRGSEAREIDPATNLALRTRQPLFGEELFRSDAADGKVVYARGHAANRRHAGGTRAGHSELQDFVKAADAQNIGIMLDAPFNHTAHDVELSSSGQKYWGNASSSAGTEIRAVEARVFSRAGEYDLRSNGAAAVAPAPDRFDFGKWTDVFDIFFGRYAALVTSQTAQEKNNYLNEGDWFDYSVGEEETAGQGSGHFDAITASVWRYFGDYLQYLARQDGLSTERFIGKPELDRGNRRSACGFRSGPSAAVLGVSHEPDAGPQMEFRFHGREPRRGTGDLPIGAALRRSERESDLRSLSAP